MKYLILLIGLVGLVGLVGCNLSQPIVEPEAVVTDTEYCKPAEINLTELGCKEFFPKKEKSFYQMCIETQDAGIFLNPKCLSNIKTCSGADICTGSK